jgi:hypothetical protein
VTPGNTSTIATPEGWGSSGRRCAGIGRVNCLHTPLPDDPPGKRYLVGAGLYPETGLLGTRWKNVLREALTGKVV